MFHFNTEDALLKLTLLHLLVSMFASLGDQSYNVGIFALGLWSLYSDKNDPSGVYLLFLVLSVLIDIVWMSIYGEDILNDNAGRDPDTKKFAFGMAIINIVVKPVTIFFAYKFFAQKTGQNSSSSSHGGISGGVSSSGGNYTDQYDQH